MSLSLRAGVSLASGLQPLNVSAEVQVSGRWRGERRGTGRITDRDLSHDLNAAGQGGCLLRHAPPLCSQAEVVAYLGGRMEQVLVEAGTPAEAGGWGSENV